MYLFGVHFGSSLHIFQFHLQSASRPVLYGLDIEMSYNKPHITVDGMMHFVLNCVAFVQAGQESGDMGSLCQFLVTAMEGLQQQLKQIRLRIPQEGSVTQLGFPDDVSATLQQCCQHAVKVMKTSQGIVKASLQQIALGGGKVIV
jgi:hypothetical protein